MSNKKKNCLNFISLHENGQLNRLHYKFEITKSKLKQFGVVPKPVECETNMTKCNFIRSSFDNTMIAILDYGEQYLGSEASITRFQFSYGSPCSNASNYNISNPFLTKLHSTYWPTNMRLRDNVDHVLNGEKYLLLSGNLYNPFPFEGLAIRIEVDSTPHSKELVWKINETIYCCASHQQSDRYALGCTDGFYVFGTKYWNKKFSFPNKNVYSLHFNSDGNGLYVSTSRGGICEVDLREKPLEARMSHFRKIDVKNGCIASGIRGQTLLNSHFIVKKMKLLSDCVSLVYTDMFGEIFKFDTRMRRVLFQYPDHLENETKRHLHLNEDLDLLCALGEDNVTRLWSLNSGKLLWEEQIAKSGWPNKESDYCCLMAEDRRWCVTVLRNGIISCIMNDENMYL